MELYKNTADYFIKYLIRHGYPSDNIAVEWGSKNCVIDVAILAFDKITPVAIFEIKGRKNKQTIEQGIYQLVRACRLLNITVPCSLIFGKDDNPFFEVIDVSDIVYNKNELDIDYIMRNHPITEPIPYENLQSSTSAKILFEKHSAKQKRIDVLKIICWLIVPICSIIILLMDAFEIYKLSAERLIVMGVLLIIILIPFFSEVSIKDFTFKRNNKN